MIKTPIYMQMEVAECGAAALGAVMGYYGCHIPLAELRYWCGVSRDGCDAYNMVGAARHFGFEAEGYRMAAGEIRPENLPAILFWDSNHFVVLEGQRNGRVWVNDPSTGRRVLGSEEFESAYSGVVLVVEPGREFRKQGKPSNHWEALRGRLTPVRWSVLMLVGIQFLLAILALLAAAFPRIFLDEVWPGRMPAHWFLAAMAGFCLLMWGVLGLEAHFLKRLQAKLSLYLSANFLWHVLRLPILFFSQRFGGEIVHRIHLNLSLTDRLAHQVMVIFPNLAFVVIYMAAMWRYDTWITAIGMMAAVLDMGAFGWVSQARKNIYARLQQEEAKAAGMVIDTLQNMETIKATGTENYFFARLIGQITKNINARQSIGRKDVWLVTGAALVQGLVSAALLGVGAWRVMAGDLTLGMLFALQFLLFNFLGPVSELVDSAAELQEFGIELMRLEDVERNHLDPALIDSKRAHEAGAEETPVRLRGLLEFREVTFGYSPLDEPLIEKLSFQVEPGRHVALVGVTGSGKSSVTKLAAGLLIPWSGEVLYDGCRREHWAPEVLAETLAAVDQQVFLISGTIRENLSLWDTTLSEAEIVRAARDACIHEEIGNLPRGYESLLVEDGRNLSAGQRQRLELARALVRNPSFLVLDEATSALDSRTEVNIIQNLRKRACSCLMVAHRLSSIRHCDEILVLDRGKVVQRGGHSELSEVDGPYRHFLEAGGGP